MTELRLFLHFPALRGSVPRAREYPGVSRMLDTVYFVYTVSLLRERKRGFPALYLEQVAADFWRMWRIRYEGYAFSKVFIE
jgi:hypothetical protein